MLECLLEMCCDCVHNKPCQAHLTRLHDPLWLIELTLDDSYSSVVSWLLQSCSTTTIRQPRNEVVLASLDELAVNLNQHDLRIRAATGRNPECVTPNPENLQKSSCDQHRRQVHARATRIMMQILTTAPRLIKQKPFASCDTMSLP